MRNALAPCFAVLLVVLAWPGLVRGDEGNLDSYEYKLMLQADRFTESERSAAMRQLWSQDLAEGLTAIPGASATGKPFTPEKDRAVRFWDTASCLLDDHGYSFRERVKIKDGAENDKKREVTLKYRGDDRTLAAGKDLSAKDEDDAKTKFEADVGAIQGQAEGQRLLFSKSTKQDIKAGKTLNKLDDPLGLYPGLEADLEASGETIDPETPLLPVSGLTVRELVFEGPVALLGDDEAAFSLTLWFDGAAGSLDHPLLAELSFTFETDDGEVSDATGALAEDLFKAMLALPQRDLSASTKTRFVYAFDSFCPS